MRSVVLVDLLLYKCYYSSMDMTFRDKLKKNRVKIIFVASKLVTLIPLLLLYFLDIISTNAFVITKFILMGIFFVFTMILLVKEVKAKRPYYKQIILLVQLVLIAILLSVYIADVIETRIFGFIKIALISTIIVVQIVLIVVSRIKTKRENRTKFDRENNIENLVLDESNVQNNDMENINAENCVIECDKSDSSDDNNCNPENSNISSNIDSL